MNMPYVTEENVTDVVLQRWRDIPDPRLRRGEVLATPFYEIRYDFVLEKAAAALAAAE
jgi:hypothetical protein